MPSIPMKVLLVHAHESAKKTAGNYQQFLKPMPPISLAYIAAALEEAGVDVSFYDDYIRGGDREAFRDFLDRERPQVIGLSCVTPIAEGVYDLARTIRNINPSIRIVMGNIHADVFAASILEKGLADFVVHGEGEVTTPHLIRVLENNEDPADVQGISFVEDGKIVQTPLRRYIENLDTIPFPAWHLFPLDRYDIFSFASVKKPGALILGSRGCPFKCTYCSLKIMGDRRRKRSAENLVDEVEMLYERFGYRQVSFTDPIFPMTKKEGLAFSAEMIRRGLDKKVVWITETRVDLVDVELLQAMREAGLRRIMYGFETGSETGQQSIRKNASLDSACRAVAMTRQAGVEMIGFFMLGVPGDTKESMEATIRFAADLDIDFAKFTVFSPFPGTSVYEDLLSKGEIEETERWESFTNYPTNENPPIYLPKGVTIRDIVSLQRKALLKFYMRPKMIYKQLFEIRTLKLSDIRSSLGMLVR